MIERLIGCDEDFRILLRIAGVDFRGVSAERRLEVAEAVVAKLGAVADEQGLAHEAGIANPAEHAGGHACFAAAGRDWQKGAGGFVVLCRADDLLEGGAHSGVLVVAEIVQALLVRDFEQFEGGGLRIESPNRKVALNEFVGCGKLGERLWVRGCACLFIGTQRTGARWMKI